MKDRPKFAAILQTSLTWERGRDEFNERTTYAYVLFAVWILCPSVCLVNERMTGGYSSKCVERKVRRRRLKGFLKVVLWTSKEQTNYVCSSSIFSEWRSEFKIRRFAAAGCSVWSGFGWIVGISVLSPRSPFRAFFFFCQTACSRGLSTLGQTERVSQFGWKRITWK